MDYESQNHKTIQAGGTFESHLVQFTAQRELASLCSDKHKLDYVFQELVQSVFECPQG